MSLYNGPPRPGARGGRDQFNWEQVKTDKDRDYWLGHSVMAPTGRWQKGKDLFWYTKGPQGQQGADALAAERAAIKAQEQAAIEEALGLRPQSLRAAQGMSQQELEDAMKQQQQQQQQGEAGGSGAGDSGHGHGLGFHHGSGAPAATDGQDRETLPGLAPAARFPPPPPLPGGPRGGDAGLMTAEQLAEMERKERRSEKKAGKVRDIRGGDGC
ncbi:Multiple myeloma tumor-associated protein 2 [Monoraphidium neglectum]|uniref:Multiple myeloma tumor-associated protein 2 n=1 Tax=Monoraphidium neglectum TaxID=145388 RepID=A0A0D2L7I9_9CHLO|nr:Multiple myeloma tumor-associated protein 2 [Monoraphidium neglectum]KIZ02819.1 Multiple myeloma tumor-associated protein 2 [Monoraphidium neglectum]|eukprot:XP_013901838.1 Multiple myeloma tumor-associated protein 2 [Monoraphidium neglectum]